MEDATDKSADLAGAARSRARAARRDAARIEASQGSAHRARSGDEERTEPLPHALPSAPAPRPPRGIRPRRRSTTATWSRCARPPTATDRS